jgi:hypothetical protein
VIVTHPLALELGIAVVAILVYVVPPLVLWLHEDSPEGALVYLIVVMLITAAIVLVIWGLL